MPSLGACLRVLALWMRGSVPPVCPGFASQAPSLPHASSLPGVPSDDAAWLCGEAAVASCGALDVGKVLLLPHASEPADPAPEQLPAPACGQFTPPLASSMHVHAGIRISTVRQPGCWLMILRVVYDQHSLLRVLLSLRQS